MPEFFSTNEIYCFQEDDCALCLRFTNKEVRCLC